MTVSANVRDFGALGDGTTDDTPAFVQALAAVAGGGALYIPAGTYIANNLDGVISADVEIDVIGEGSADTVLRASQAVKHVLAMHSPTSITGVSCDGNSLVSSALAVTTHGVPIASASLSDVAAFGVAPDSQGWTFAAWDLAWRVGMPMDIALLSLTDCRFAGPSSQVQDGMAISGVDTVVVNRLVLDSLYRSPNFYAIGTLIADGISVVNVPHVASVVFDHNVAQADVRNLTVDDASQKVMAKGPSIALTGGSFPGLRTNPNANPQALKLAGCTLTGALALQAAGVTLDAEDCNSAPGDESMVHSYAPAGTVEAGWVLLRNTFRSTNVRRPMVASQNPITLVSPQVSGNDVAPGVATYSPSITLTP